MRARELVSCGRSWGGQDVRVVEPESGTVCEEGRVGEVWVRGPSVAGGYWERPEATAADFGGVLADGTGPFLRTGDLGFLRGGELYVTGRLKDLIILRGRNHYPQDVELTAERATRRCGPGAERRSPSRWTRAKSGWCWCRRSSAALAEEALAGIVEAIRRAVAEEHEALVSRRGAGAGGRRSRRPPAARSSAMPAARDIWRAAWRC